MGISPGTTHEAGALDHVITNSVILDPILGVIKADIGIRNGKIAGIGKAGNPGLMDNVDRNMVVSNSTEVTAGEGLIATAGFFDSHIHMICPQQAFEALETASPPTSGAGPARQKGHAP